MADKQHGMRLAGIIARRMAKEAAGVSRRRSAWAKHETIGLCLDVQDQTPGVSDVAERFDTICGELPEAARRILWRCFYDGATHAEVAKEEGVDRSVISKRIKDILDQLRALHPSQSALFEALE